MIDTERTLTVSGLHREWGEVHRRKRSVVPSIRLNGKWLSALGIMPGHKIRVVAHGAIIPLAPVSFDGDIRRYESESD